MKLLVNSILLLLLPIGLCAQNGWTIQSIDPLTNAVPTATLPALADDTLRVARGENAVLQLAISSIDPLSDLSATLHRLKAYQGDALKEVTLGWVRQVRAAHHYTPTAPDALQSPSGEYPDPILTDTTLHLAAGERALLWIDIPIPTKTKAGIYHGTIRLTALRGGKRVATDHLFTIRVYPVMLPKQSLLITNWFFPEKFSYMNGGRPVADDSPVYWECMRQLVQTASAYGQNVWLLDEVGTPVVSSDGKRLSFDFTRMDKSIEFLLRHADVRLIEANHFAKRSHNKWVDPFWAKVPVLDGKGGYTQQRLPYDDPAVKSYLASYFSALQTHLRSKQLHDGSGRSWLDIYTQHVADEPLDENRESWEGLARQVKQAAPDIRIIEAYRANGYDPELIDILVPQLDEFAGDNYRTMPENHSCWFYTCMYPRSNFANRYVTLPLLKTRLLHWINYKYKAPGYLHWGFNFWGENGDPFGDVSAPLNDWPGGDSHIVYPGYRKLYPSIRLAAMRDGIRDYELLRMVAAKDPACAQAFANDMVLDFDRYNTSIPHFRAIRRQMLEFLSSH